jgi:hypothetical protein
MKNQPKIQFKDLPLVDKIILYERHEIRFKRDLLLLYQELIDMGLCWSDEMPNHYARWAARFLRQGECKHSLSVPTPVEAQHPHYLEEQTRLGCDDWDRPPTHEHYGRAWRWKEVRREKIKEYKERLKLQEAGEDFEPASCCKK